MTVSWQPKVMVEWVVFLLRVLEVEGSNPNLEAVYLN
jgi:hypothetical protein